MPVFFQKDIDDCTKLAIWKIEEDENFFLQHVLLQREITHPHKRLQHLAGRYLLKYLFPQFPVSLIQIADSRKPFLDDDAFHFSISHCAEFVAVIVSKENRVGVDIELARPKVERIKHKFISDEEKDVYNNLSTYKPINLTTLLWSCKEAVFKWYSLGDVDFREHIQLKKIIESDKNSFETIVLFKKNEGFYLNLHSMFFDDLCLSFVVT